MSKLRLGLRIWLDKILDLNKSSRLLGSGQYNLKMGWQRQKSKSMTRFRRQKRLPVLPKGKRLESCDKLS